MFILFHTKGAPRQVALGSNGSIMVIKTPISLSSCYSSIPTADHAKVATHSMLLSSQQEGERGKESHFNFSLGVTHRPFI